MLVNWVEGLLLIAAMGYRYMTLSIVGLELDDQDGLDRGGRQSIWSYVYSLPAASHPLPFLAISF